MAAPAGDEDAPLAGRSAVVTGATGPIGRAIAEALARVGAHVVLVARSPGALAEAVMSIGADATGIAADVASPDAVDALAARVEAAVGAPGVLVNAAGVFGPLARVTEGDPEDWVRTQQVNLVGPYLTCRAFAPDMVRAGWGRILNVSSAAALHAPGTLNSAYSTSKAALNRLTAHLAAELAGTGVTAATLHPGDVKTEMWGAIAAAAEQRGEDGAELREWVAWVDRTGGDPPELAARLVLDHVLDPDAPSGGFLWPRGALQPPPEGVEPV